MSFSTGSEQLADPVIYFYCLLMLSNVVDSWIWHGNDDLVLVQGRGSSWSRENLNVALDRRKIEEAVAIASNSTCLGILGCKPMAISCLSPREIDRHASMLRSCPLVDPAAMAGRIQGFEFRLSKNFGHGRNHRISQNFGRNSFLDYF